MAEAAFPTRSYPYRWRNPAEGPVFTDAVPAGKFLKFFLGRDQPPGREVTSEERGQLADAFVRLVLDTSRFPTTLVDLLAIVDEWNDRPAGLPQQLSFVVAEGGQVPWSPQTSHVRRGFRLVVARGRGNRFSLFVSTAAPTDSATIFLQVLAWDPEAGAFQFYERRGGSWLWAGSSWQALEEDTRGQGPFDSHINGGMVMKELELPWLHWHSMAQTITPEVLPPGDPLRNEPLFLSRAGAERLEAIVKNNVSQWTQSRLSREVKQDGSIERPDWLMRQILETSAPTIASSPQTYAGDEDAPISIPLTFFLDKVGLLDVAALDLNPSFAVERGRYQEMAGQIGLAVRDTRSNPPVRIEGDTFFAWPVPEPGIEDLALLKALVRKGVLSKRFVAALLMVDFPNPVGSPRRARFMQYVPAGAGAGTESIEAQMLRTLEAAEWPDASPELELLENARLSDAQWPAEYAQRLRGYFEAVEARLATEEGLRDFMLLADSRRREFRRRPIAEFDMTLPWVDVGQEAALLEMTQDARVVKKG